jgi:RNA-directed DNA polymerase
MDATANVRYGTTDWQAIDWRHAHQVVRNLRQRIFKATARGDWKRVRSLQKLLLRSWSNRAVSVRKVTQCNQGKNTPGVDRVLVKTPQARGALIDALKTYRPENCVFRSKITGPFGPKLPLNSEQSYRLFRWERFHFLASCRNGW